LPRFQEVGGVKGIPLQNPLVDSGVGLPKTQGLLGGAAVEMGSGNSMESMQLDAVWETE
jgi:hypothetical protein